MAAASQQLPIDGAGECMVCKKTALEVEKLLCKTCVTPWHVDCLTVRPETIDSTLHWNCPDCSELPSAGNFAAPVESGASGELVAAIKAIEADASLSEQEKAKRRQKLLSGSGDDGVEGSGKDDDNEIIALLGEKIQCSFCMQLPDRPVTTPCGHNFCLKCFEKWIGQGKKTCAKCRVQIPAKMASQPRINSIVVSAIRMARMRKTHSVGPPKVIHCVHNEDLPDEAFTTERAKKSGIANAKSGKIFVTVPKDHLGPITAEYDPVRNTGVLVGESWGDRMACRQWGAHFPHVSGIAGQSGYGAQSVVLSGGYEDDEDHGEWFLYTGSGGRDLSGNKRTNKKQSSDQTFTSSNEALRLSCKKGYPVRVVRSHKEKRSNYPPEEGVRYDGIYRIEKCWRKDGQQGYVVCRYLFVRCDNSPAPWTSDEHGDRPRPLPEIPELKGAKDITERKESPHWDFDVTEGCWKWNKHPPPSNKLPTEKGTATSRPKKNSKAKILKEFNCLICNKVLQFPITTPCAHNFCKSCLNGAFEGQKYLRERNTGGRQLRTQKNVMKCPSCPTDISEFLQNAQVNRELMGAIESLLCNFEEEEKETNGVVGQAETSEITANDNQEEASDNAENNLSDSDEIESEPLKDENSNLGETEPENSEAKNKTATQSSTGAKRGLKRKNPEASSTVGVEMKKRGSKTPRVAEDGNVSPSSPLHVRSPDHEIQ